MKQLPHDYYEHATLDLSKNKRAAILMNVANIPLLFIWGYLFIGVTQLVNPTFIFTDFVIEYLSSIGNLLVLMIALIGSIFLHELVHGLFFLWFTGERPVYGYSWLYAYAGAPDWYLPKRQSIIVSLAPLFVISLLGMIWLPFIESPAVIPLLLVLITNATGAVGDTYVAIWLLGQPSNILYRDTGPAFTIYHRKSDKSA